MWFLYRREGKYDVTCKYILENIQVHPLYYSEESLIPNKSNPTKHDGYNIAFGVIGPVTEDSMITKTLPFPTCYLGDNDPRLGEVLIAGYPAYMLNQKNFKSEVNYFAHGMAGASPQIS